MRMNEYYMLLLVRLWSHYSQTHQCICQHEHVLHVSAEQFSAMALSIWLSD